MISYAEAVLKIWLGNNRYMFSLLFYVTCSNAELKLIIFLNHMYRSRQSPQATDTS
jgi:hypothetical protein